MGEARGRYDSGRRPFRDTSRGQSAIQTGETDDLEALRLERVLDGL